MTANYLQSYIERSRGALMSEPLFDRERQLEMEMLDAAQHVSDVSHVEKDPLLIILWRLNHQDRTLEAIKGEVKKITTLVSDHISRKRNQGVY
ncbi:MAG: hypothetical protein IPJ49_31205 [Candidatus Obscuribacter sp.]|nr:hypothetical protein [Candidatus Obscuribacter sp.]